MHNNHVNKNKHYHKNPSNWYDSECREKKNIFDMYEKQFRFSGSHDDRINMCQARNNYRKCCRNKRRKHQIDKAEELHYLSKNNPQQFWKKIKRKKNEIGDCDFFSHFKNLFSNNPALGSINSQNRNLADVAVEFLDNQISSNELEKAISKLKNNKSCGEDGIINEFIKHSNIHIYNVILSLFNTILDTGFFPAKWSVGAIVPVHKKGDVNDPLNYRGITLVSCLGKLFTNIINERLNIWAEEESIFSENQFGFRKQKSTTDCIFVLQGLIEHFFNNSKQLYCSFVELTRAFDSLNRNALKYKLNYYGVSSKLIKVIKKNMYNV